jgi:CRISPR-associated protein Cas1
MPTLYITEQGATLRKEANRLVVERDNLKLAEVHDFNLERVVIFGNVQLTTQAMSFLLDRGIDTAIVSNRGRLKGRLAPLQSKNVTLRLRQFERLNDSRFALEFARAVVTGKLSNCLELLAKHQRSHPTAALHGSISGVTAMKDRAQTAGSVDALRGIEGQAAACYFEGFALMLRRGFPFTSRSRRPPRDPVNALLSLGYTLLYNEAIAALAAAGFDPYFGFLHKTHYGRCSLALDLIEDFRPVAADRLALNLINLEALKPVDFATQQGGGVLLGSDGRKRFLREYERLMTAEFNNRKTGEATTLRRALYGQALTMQRAVFDSTPYQAFHGWR